MSANLLAGVKPSITKHATESDGVFTSSVLTDRWYDIALWQFPTPTQALAENQTMHLGISAKWHDAAATTGRAWASVKYADAAGNINNANIQIEGITTEWKRFSLSTVVPAGMRIVDFHFSAYQLDAAYDAMNPVLSYGSPIVLAMAEITATDVKDGKSPTVSVSKSGTVTTIVVTNADGSKTTQTVNDGVNGTPGAKGADGRTPYFHVKYSNDGGKTFTANSGETVGTYIGTCTDFNSADPTAVGSYKWAKIKGEQGVQGNPGTNGKDGKDFNWNLLIDTKAFGRSNASADNTGYLRNFSGILGEEYKGFVSRSVTSAYKGQVCEYIVNDCKPGEAYTASFWAKGSGILTCLFYGPSGYILVDKTKASTGAIKYGGDGNIAITVSDTWTRYWVEFTLADTAGSTSTKYFLIRNDAAGTYSVCGVKLERGSVATDWCPAQEDLKGDTGPQGPKGDTGADGETGDSVAGVTTEYYLSTSNSSQAGSSWSESPQPYVSGCYYWTRSHVTYKRSDGTTYDAYTDPVLDQGLNSANETATEVKVTTDTISAKVEKKVDADKLISSINASAEAIAIKSSKIALEGLVTANKGFTIDTEGSMKATNGYFSGIIAGATLQVADGSGNNRTAITADGRMQSVDSAQTFWLDLKTGAFQLGPIKSTGELNQDLIVSRMLNVKYGLEIWRQNANNEPYIDFHCESDGPGASGSYDYSARISCVRDGYLQMLGADKGDGTGHEHARLEVGGLELYTSGGGIPYIDFHLNDTAADYTMRIAAETTDSLVLRCESGGSTIINVKAGKVVSGSSRRIKTNIKDISDQDAEKLLELRPVSFNYIYDDPTNKNYGLIAEEVQSVLPELVYVPDGYKADADSDTTNVPRLAYADFIPYLIRLCQIQQKEIDALRKGE